MLKEHTSATGLSCTSRLYLVPCHYVFTMTKNRLYNETTTAVLLFFNRSCVNTLSIYTMLEISKMVFPHWWYFFQRKAILGEIEMAAVSLEHQKKRLLLLSTDWESQPTLWFNIDNLTHKNLISSVTSNFKAHITPLTDTDMLNELTFALHLLQISTQ